MEIICLNKKIYLHKMFSSLYQFIYDYNSIETLECDIKDILETKKVYLLPLKEDYSKECLPIKIVKYKNKRCDFKLTSSWKGYAVDDILDKNVDILQNMLPFYFKGKGDLFFDSNNFISLNDKKNKYLLFTVTKNLKPIEITKTIKKKQAHRYLIETFYIEHIMNKLQPLIDYDAYALTREENAIENIIEIYKYGEDDTTTMKDISKKIKKVFNEDNDTIYIKKIYINEPDTLYIKYSDIKIKGETNG